MATDLFSSLLQELSPLVNAGEELCPDGNNSCLIKLANGVMVQVEPYAKSDHIIVGFPLGEVLPGKYRQELFRIALISNGQPPPNLGVFACKPKSGMLILFAMLPTKNLTGAKIAEVLLPLSEKALIWQEAITRGEVPALFLSRGGASFGGLFGLAR